MVHFFQSLVLLVHASENTLTVNVKQRRYLMRNLSWLVSLSVWNQTRDTQHIIAFLSTRTSWNMLSVLCLNLNSLRRLCHWSWLHNPKWPKQEDVAKDLLKELPECSSSLYSQECQHFLSCSTLCFLKAVPLLSWGMWPAVLLYLYTEGTDCMFRLQIQSSNQCFLL